MPGIAIPPAKIPLGLRKKDSGRCRPIPIDPAATSYGTSLNMQVNVSARHGSLQPGDQELIEEKTIKLRRLYDRINAIEVTIDLKQLDKPSVEIQVSAEHADDMVAHAEATTVIAALDNAIPKVEQQLRKLKARKTDHRTAAHKHIELVEVDDDESTLDE
ncbi:ribosome hibernation-promoting factor, HPF/YfiA family [Neorhodopirellula pilleata]|nr:ribosome-associated translation inhibitor RaiA [Neorhodopirellula pilleata]